MSERKTVTVYRDDLEFILREWQEFLGDYDVFCRRRFSVSASITRLQGILGQVEDEDKTPVRPAFESRSMTKPGGHKIGE